MSDPAHREALGLLRAGVPPAAWPEALQPLASALRPIPAAEHASADELREAAYRVQLPALERRAQALRDAGRRRRRTAHDRSGPAGAGRPAR